MSRGARDDKSAFDAMMSEISDEDEDEDVNRYIRPGQRGRTSSNQSQPKRGSAAGADYSAGSKDSKTSSNSTASTTGQYKQSFPSQTHLQASVQGQSNIDDEIENFGVDPNAGGNMSSDAIRKAELAELKRWLMRPCRPSDPPLKCFVERDKSGFNRLHPVFRLYMEGNQAGNGVANPHQGLDGVPDAKSSGDSTPMNARFLILATKQTNSKTSSYLFSCENGSQSTIDDRGSEYVLGKLKGNAIGSQYLIVDNGRSPEKATGPSMTRKEYGVVRFEFDSGGPGVVEAWVPSVNSSGSTCAHWQPDSSAKSMSTLIETFAESVSTGTGTSTSRTNNDSKSSGAFSPTPDSDQFSKLFMLKNKKPKWDDAHGGHVLNFQGRVTMSSVKNFQLCVTTDWHTECLLAARAASGRNGRDTEEELKGRDTEDSPEPLSQQHLVNDVILQFGKVSQDRFTMDVQYPLSIYQAYAICVACMDGKIADRRGYEYVKRLTGYGVNSNGDTGADSAVSGSISGSKTLAGSIMEALPSSKYITEKFKRSSITGK